MAKKTENYVVGILYAYEDRTEIKFVTSIGTKPKVAMWEDGEDAMIFSKDYATDVAFGLCVNGYVAIPIIKADYLNLSNPKLRDSTNI